jgi:hypothetical protein
MWPALPNPGTMLRKRLFDAFGMYDVNISIAGDYEWFSRVGGSAEFKHAGRPVAKWRHHSFERATHGGTDIYDITVAERMIERYSAEQLFPNIRAADLPPATRKALYHLSILLRFVDLQAQAQALRHFKLFLAEKPPKDLVEQAERAMNTFTE